MVLMYRARVASIARCNSPVDGAEEHGNAAVRPGLQRGEGLIEGRGVAV